MTKHPHPHQKSYECKMSDLLGRVIIEVQRHEDRALNLVCAEGTFTFYHLQDCCESVYLADVTGSFDDLLNTPLLLAEESTSHPPINRIDDEYGEDSVTWTFYKLATIKGFVDLRWVGESNGYYSESVDLTYTPKETS